MLLDFVNKIITTTRVNVVKLKNIYLIINQVLLNYLFLFFAILNDF
jgi:hypothetical protein